MARVWRKWGAPHFRHSKAMHLLQSGVNLVYIRDLLGHSDISTTEIYARADEKMKRKALMEAYNSPSSNELPAWKKDKDLLDWLKSL
ncbi:tyrosine-type recombinase/integrase [Otoolea muris]|uniref:tyrosine-type recombinase/integrase n=1 Tax=Otoolea muris TaxID=2941515 RepID=UPI002FE6C8F6